MYTCTGAVVEEYDTYAYEGSSSRCFNILYSVSESMFCTLELSPQSTRPKVELLRRRSKFCGFIVLLFQNCSDDARLMTGDSNPLLTSNRRDRWRDRRISCISLPFALCIKWNNVANTLVHRNPFVALHFVETFVGRNA